MEKFKPWENVVLMNKPPTPEQIPEYAMRSFARALIRATKEWLEEKEKNREKIPENIN